MSVEKERKDLPCPSCGANQQSVRHQLSVKTLSGDTYPGLSVRLVVLTWSHLQYMLDKVPKSSGLSPICQFLFLRFENLFKYFVLLHS